MDLQCAECLKHAHREDSKTGIPKTKVSDAVTLINGTAYCLTHSQGVSAR